MSRKRAMATLPDRQASLTLWATTCIASVVLCPEWPPNWPCIFNLLAPSRWTSGLLHRSPKDVAFHDPHDLQNFTVTLDVNLCIVHIQGHTADSIALLVPSDCACIDTILSCGALFSRIFLCAYTASTRCSTSKEMARSRPRHVSGPRESTDLAVHPPPARTREADSQSSEESPSTILIRIAGKLGHNWKPE